MPVKDIEETSDFTPKYDKNGLIPCIVTSARTGEVLMLAWMNAGALDKTRTSGEAHFWSRSRNELWRKGATSGQIQKVKSLRIDCDQDCLLMSVEMPEPETACHTGRKSCFYREVQKDGNKLVIKV